jgi:hypothetical protein
MSTVTFVVTMADHRFEGRTFLCVTVLDDGQPDLLAAQMAACLVDGHVLSVTPVAI